MKYKLTLTFTLILSLFIIFPVVSEAKIDFGTPLNGKESWLTGCKLDKAVTDEFLEVRGIKKSIKVGGKTLNIDKKMLKDACIVVYGSDKDVPAKTQTKDSRGNPKYIGYNESGKLYAGFTYLLLPDAYKGNLLKERDFIKNPWSKNNDIKSKAAYAGIPKATANKRSKLMQREGVTITDILNTPVDTMYVRYKHKKSTAPSETERRGNFVQARKGTQPSAKLSGSVLKDYANIINLPTEYSPGDIVLYHKCYSGKKICYSGYVIPPLSIDKLGKEKEELTLTSFVVSPKEVWEKETVNAKFEVKNTGDLAIKNAKVDLNLTCDSGLGKSKKTVNLTAGGKLFTPDQSRKGNVSFKMPSLAGKKVDSINCSVEVSPGSGINKNNFKTKSGVNKKQSVEVKRIKKDVYVKDIEVLEDESGYFNEYKNPLRLFEGNVVHYRYKLGFASNKKGEKITNPLVDIGGSNIEAQEKLNISLTANKNKSGNNGKYDLKYFEETGWIYPDFKSDEYNYKSLTKKKFEAN